MTLRGTLGRWKPTTGFQLTLKHPPRLDTYLPHFQTWSVGRANAQRFSCARTVGGGRPPPPARRWAPCSKSSQGRARSTLSSVLSEAHPSSRRAAR
eukprot:scaffold65795_cov60-Phaeocystis_antarctica.AAC.3